VREGVTGLSGVVAKSGGDVVPPCDAHHAGSKPRKHYQRRPRPPPRGRGAGPGRPIPGPRGPIPGPPGPIPPGGPGAPIPGGPIPGGPGIGTSRSRSRSTSTISGTQTGNHGSMYTAGGGGSGNSHLTVAKFQYMPGGQGGGSGSALPTAGEASSISGRTANAAADKALCCSQGFIAHLLPVASDPTIRAMSGGSIRRRRWRLWQPWEWTWISVEDEHGGRSRFERI
jgi:hypothetical protein